MLWAYSLINCNCLVDSTLRWKRNLQIPFQLRILQQLSLTIHVFFICFLVAQTVRIPQKCFYLEQF